MSASSFRHVLALLDDGAEAMWGVVDRAVALAEAEHARLTLAAVSDPGVVVNCLCALSVVVVCTVPSDAELEATAADRLAQAAEGVPASTPLTTVVLGRDTARALGRLVESGCHDVLIARAGLLAHDRRLRRAIRKLAISTLVVAPGSVPQPPPASREAFRPRPARQT